MGYGEDSAIVQHEQSKGHKDAVVSFKSYNVSKQASVGTVVDQISDQTTIELNKLNTDIDHLNFVIDSILFCAKQDLALRGHREACEEKNRGNFLELNEFVKKYSPEVQNTFDKAKVKNLSPSVQNLILRSAVEAYKQDLKADLRGKKFAILSDATRDGNKREVEAVFVRFIKDGSVHERTVGFVDISTDLTAKGVSTAIINLLASFELDPDNCVGFSFDGASVMSGKHNGVQAILKETFKYAVYVHCNSHRLNLVLQQISATSTESKSTIDLCNTLHTFFGHPGRNAILNAYQKQHNPKPTKKSPYIELSRPTDTRWLSNYTTINHVYRLLQSILDALDHLLDDEKIAAEATGLLRKIGSKKFLFTLTTLNQVLGETSIATKVLQDHSNTTTDVSSCIEILQNILATYRSDEGFKHRLEDTNDMIAKYDITLYDDSIRRRQRRKTIITDYITYLPTGQKDDLEFTDFESKLKSIYYEIIDLIQTEIKLRFSQESLDIYNAAEAVIKTQDFSGGAFANRVGINVAEVEAKHFKGHCIKKLKLKDSSLIDYLQECESVKSTFPNVHNLLEALVTCPTTSVSVERLFSTVQRVHSPYRKKMTIERLNDLCILSFEREATTKLQGDLNRIRRIFRQLSK